MSTKRRRVLSHYWYSLYDCISEYQRMVTAGELAKYMGVSRNTAAKWLWRLSAEEAVNPQMYTAKNGTKGWRFDVVERD